MLAQTMRKILPASAYYGGLDRFLNPNLMKRDATALELLMHVDRWQIRKVALRRPRYIRTLIQEAIRIMEIPGWERGSAQIEMRAFNLDSYRLVVRYAYGLLRTYHVETKQLECPNGDTELEKCLAWILQAELAVSRNLKTRNFRKYCREYGLDWRMEDAAIRARHTRAAS